MDIVEQEWQARIANNLPPYHSIDDQDIGFKFNKPIVKDIATNAFLNGEFNGEDVADFICTTDTTDYNF